MTYTFYRQIRLRFAIECAHSRATRREVMEACIMPHQAE